MKARFGLVWSLALVTMGGLPAPSIDSESSTQKMTDPGTHPIMLVIHGGAGAIRPGRLSPNYEAAIRKTMAQALEAGYTVLKRGGSSVDAVETVLTILEDSPLFNAGRGAVATTRGTHELDASIMDGRTLSAGAVAGVQRVKNPIRLARAVMEKSPHVLLIGEGAEQFTQRVGIELVDPSYFEVPKPKERSETKSPADSTQVVQEAKRLHRDRLTLGTVGAVALDQWGNLAAGTSTGGIPKKWPGRVGDSPIIGAGTYADNLGCAVSATGHGEYFIRLAVAHDIDTMVKYQGRSVEESARRALEKVARLGGEGGVIVLDREGHFAMVFNTPGMFRGYIGPDGRPVVRLYREVEEGQPHASASSHEKETSQH